MAVKIDNVQVKLTVKVGNAKLQLRQLKELEIGSVIELDKLANTAMDIFINDKKVAEGDIVVFSEYYGIRITKVLE